jgi:hypothetical protein
MVNADNNRSLILGEEDNWPDWANCRPLRGIVCQMILKLTHQGFGAFAAPIGMECLRTSLELGLTPGLPPGFTCRQMPTVKQWLGEVRVVDLLGKC